MKELGSVWVNYFSYNHANIMRLMKNTALRKDDIFQKIVIVICYF